MSWFQLPGHWHIEGKAAFLNSWLWWQSQEEYVSWASEPYHWLCINRYSYQSCLHSPMLPSDAVREANGPREQSQGPRGTVTFPREQIQDLIKNLTSSLGLKFSQFPPSKNSWLPLTNDHQVLPVLFSKQEHLLKLPCFYFSIVFWAQVEGDTLLYSFVGQQTKCSISSPTKDTAHHPELLNFMLVVVTGSEFEFSPLGKEWRCSVSRKKSRHIRKVRRENCGIDQMSTESIFSL